MRLTPVKDFKSTALGRLPFGWGGFCEDLEGDGLLKSHLSLSTPYPPFRPTGCRETPVQPVMADDQLAVVAIVDMVVLVNMTLFIPELQSRVK